jgi:predicted transcriptional regulator
LPKPNPEEKAEISKLVKGLIKNPLTRNKSLARANILLSNDEVQNTYQELKDQLIEEEREG